MYFFQIYKTSLIKRNDRFCVSKLSRHTVDVSLFIGSKSKSLNQKGATTVASDQFCSMLIICLLCMKLETPFRSEHCMRCGRISRLTEIPFLPYSLESEATQQRACTFSISVICWRWRRAWIQCVTLYSW